MSIQDAINKARSRKNSEATTANFKQVYNKAFPVWNALRSTNTAPKKSITLSAAKAAPSAIGGLYSDYAEKQKQAKKITTEIDMFSQIHPGHKFL